MLRSFIYFVFVWPVEDYRNWSKLSCRPLAFNSNKAFLRNKKRSGTNVPASFSAWFWQKNPFSCYILLPDQNFNVWLPLPPEVLDNMCSNSLLTRLWHKKFCDQSDLSNQAVFSTSTKSQDKNLNILRAKRAFKMK